MSGIVYACDIGSVKSCAFAWARNTSINETPIASPNIDGLIASIVRDASSGASISLGFEAPLFLPIPDSSDQLNSGRTGDSNRSVFAPAGAAVTTIGVHESAWILKHLRNALHDELPLSMDWLAPWRSQPQKLFVWETFVSSTAHSDTHERDAATALQYFLENESDLDSVNAVTCNNPLSLIAAAALWSGWLSDIGSLHSSCLVLRPNDPYGGPINPE